MEELKERKDKPQERWAPKPCGTIMVFSHSFTERGDKRKRALVGSLFHLDP